MEIIIGKKYSYSFAGSIFEGTLLKIEEKNGIKMYYLNRCGSKTIYVILEKQFKTIKNELTK